MKRNPIKFILSGGFFILLLATLISCGNTFHNGTEMTVSKISVTGLPASIYAGRSMVFSYDTGGGWIHDKPALFDSGTYSSVVTESGDWTVTFSPPLVVTTASISFLLIDSGKNWDTYKIDKKHSGKGGGDVVIDNTWGGLISPTSFNGVVNGDNVVWTIE